MKTALICGRLVIAQERPINLLRSLCNHFFPSHHTLYGENLLHNAVVRAVHAEVDSRSDKEIEELLKIEPMDYHDATVMRTSLAWVAATDDHITIRYD